MIVYHDSTTPVLFKKSMDLNDQDWFFVVWENVLGLSESIKASSWFLDSGISDVQTIMSVPVQDVTKCNQFTKANGVKLSPNQLGTFKVENQIVTNNNRVLNRAFKIIVNSSFPDEALFTDSIFSNSTISVKKFNKVVSIKN